MDFAPLDHFYDALAALDTEGTIVYCNESFAQIVGLSEQRILGKMTIPKLFLEFDGHPVSPADLKTKDATNSRVVQFKTKTNEDGTGQYSLIPLTQNGQNYILFVMRDLTLEDQLKRKYKQEMDFKDRKISEMKSLNQLLQKTRLVREPAALLNEFAHHVLQQFQLEIAYLMTPEKIVSCISLNDHPANTPLMTSLSQAQLPAIYKTYTAQEWPLLNMGSTPGLEKLIIIPVRSAPGKTYLLAIPIYTDLLMAHLDQETIKTLAEQMSLMLENRALEKLSAHDDLTGLFNARVFREKLDEFTGIYKDLNLILLDIDFFKTVNDTYGHPAGDAVLKILGKTLKTITIEDGVVARIGGEEFALLIPHRSEAQVLAIAERLAEQIRALEINYEGTLIKITSSFGISTWNPQGMQVREFYKTADEALYFSKKNGRNRITTYRSLIKT